MRSAGTGIQGMIPAGSSAAAASPARRHPMLTSPSPSPAPASAAQRTDRRSRACAQPWRRGTSARGRLDGFWKAKPQPTLVANSTPRQRCMMARLCCPWGEREGEGGREEGRG